jgi:DNA-binding transcriptional LysR family regulator
MELRQLEYLIAVAEEANFTRAAQRVHISQSGVSAQIRQLERELGAPLIDRSGRSATLTAAGVAALPRARQALDAVDGLRDAVDEVTGVVRGRLRIGMVTACTVTPLFDALASFHQARPGIELSLYEDNSDRLIDRVRSGQTDIALVGTPGQLPGDLTGLPIISEPIVAAVAPDHLLAKRRRLPLHELQDTPMVCLPVGTGIRAVFDQACAAAGFRPEIALEATAPGAVADLAVRGLGVAVLSRSMVTTDDRLRAIELDVAQPAVLALVWGPTPSPALVELIKHAGVAFGRR